MDLQIGDIQETALITLAIRSSETARPNARIKDDLAKEIPVLGRHTKQHDAVKYTNAQFKWGTKSGKEYLDLEPRMSLVSERSYNEEMKKYSVRAKLFALFLPHLNNRLAVYRW